MLPFLSKYQCAFDKGYSTQHCLLPMLEKWTSAVDKGKSFGVLLIDLAKAFDCLSQVNIFLCDLFFIMNETDFASYGDDNTPYRTANTTDWVI